MGTFLVRFWLLSRGLIGSRDASSLIMVVVMDSFSHAQGLSFKPLLKFRVDFD